MRQYVNDFIETLSDRRQRRVGDILQEVLISKENLTILSDKLKSEFFRFTPLSLPVVARNAQINGIKHYSNMREFQLRVNELYTISGFISNLIDSHAGVLTSQIKTIEDELGALEKISANYAFLLSDSKSYNFAYIEPFNDEYGRETDFHFNIPDRANLTFDPYQAASIRSDEGTLCLSSFLHNQPLNGRILDSNCMAYAKEATQLSESFVEGSDTGWQVVIASPTPITNALHNYTNLSGAQIILELSIPQPAPASEIKLSPFADYSIQLAQVILYPKDEDGGTTKLLTAPITLDKPTTLHFPMQSVSRVRVVLVQPIYERFLKQTNQTEVVSSTVSSHKSRIIHLNRNRHNNQIITSGIKIHLPSIIDMLRKVNLQRVVRLFSIHPISSESIDLSVKPSSISLKSNVVNLDFAISNSIPTDFQFNRWGNQRIDGMLNDTKDKLMNIESWLGNSFDQEHVFNAALSIIPDMSEIFRRISSQFNFSFNIFGPNHRNGRPTDPRDPVTPLPPPVPLPPAAIGYEYLYKIGLYHIGIGIGEVGQKGHFVSKALDVNGDIGQIRLKSFDINYISSNELLDSPIITSIEYSVSNKANPALESDWFPILPAGKDDVTAERFYTDIAGVGYFRFPADPKSFIAVYKNGNKLGITSDNWLKAANGLDILGVRIPFGQYTTEDYLTVDYRPSSQFGVVSFENEGFNQTPLVASFDSTGAGESFSSSTGANEITLAFTPYIDDQQVATSNYSAIFGLTPYQPVVVKFDDGTLARNLTNYSGGVQAVLPASDDYYFIQSGQVLKFNQPVISKFRVYYQHLQNNVRVRVVLRSNSKDFVSPKVDYFQVKAKTRRPTTKSM